MVFNSIKQKLLPNYKKRNWPGLINAYKNYLPVTKQTPIITKNRHVYFIKVI